MTTAHNGSSMALDKKTWLAVSQEGSLCRPTVTEEASGPGPSGEKAKGIPLSPHNSETHPAHRNAHRSLLTRTCVHTVGRGVGGVVWAELGACGWEASRGLLLGGGSGEGDKARASLILLRTRSGSERLLPQEAGSVTLVSLEVCPLSEVSPFHGRSPIRLHAAGSTWS